MYEIKQNGSGSCELILSGSVNIQNISELKNSLFNIYKELTSLVIDQSAAENMDLSYLQFLISLKNTMNMDGKVLEIKNINNNALSSLLKTGGLLEKEFFKEALMNNPKGMI